VTPSPCHPVTLSLVRAALVDGQKAMLHRQGEDGHGGAVGAAALLSIGAASVPEAAAALHAEQQGMQPRTVHRPVVAAQLKSRLRTVVDRIEEPLLLRV